MSWPRQYFMHILERGDHDQEFAAHALSTIRGDDDCISVLNDPIRVRVAAKQKGTCWRGCRISVRDEHCHKELNDRTSDDHRAQYALRRAE